MLVILAGDTASCNRFSAFSSCSGQNVTLLAGCCWPLQTLLGPALESECITLVIFREEDEEEEEGEEVAVVLDKEVEDDVDAATFLDTVDVPLTDADRVTGVLTWRGGEALLTPSSTSRSILLSVFIVSIPLLTLSRTTRLLRGGECTAQ